MSFVTGEGTPQDQANAICYQKWRDRKKESRERKPDDPHGAGVDIDHEAIIPGVGYPEVPEMDLPDHLKPRHERDPNAELEEKLRQP
jgi:hypothetical protein